MERGQLSNDLPNASTPGCKAHNAEQTSVADLLLWNSNTGTAVGSLSMGSRITKVVTDPSQPLQSTGDPLDVALDGPGFLAVSTGLGVRYTRDGELVIDGDGRLATNPSDVFGCLLVVGLDYYKTGRRSRAPLPIRTYHAAGPYLCRALTRLPPF